MAQRNDGPPAEILWDRWGVPHIFASDVADLFHAYGYAQMRNHGDLILRLYAQARGRGAEFFGEEYLEPDRLTRIMGIPTRAPEWVASQSVEFREYLRSFCDGINDYARMHPDALDPAAHAVLPVEPADTMAHMQRMLFTFLTLQGQNGRPNNSLQLVTQGIPGLAGSNGWAIAPGYSTSGNALHLGNPHLSWSDLFVWFEAQLTTPGYDAYGVTLVGSPVLTIGFNDCLAWTHTVNTFDGWDAYLLTSAGDGYRFDGEERAFETETQTLLVRQDDGSLREETLEIRRSVHGPVIAERDGQPVAVRVVGLDVNPATHAADQWWQMGRSDNLDEFLDALRMMQLPMFNTIYADRDGHVLAQYCGMAPMRAQGDWNFWAGLVPGDTSATLWDQIHPYEDLPRVIDPPTGWVQNSNSPPWTYTLPPLDPDAFPPYLAPRWLNGREQSALRMLLEHGPFSFDDLVAATGSTKSETALHLIDDLVQAAENGSDLAREAARVLAEWDRAFDAESRGAALFAQWIAEMLPLNSGVTVNDLFAKPWDPNLPLDTPTGLANAPEAIAGLERAAIKLRELAGSLDVAWGNVFRLRLDGTDYDLPSNGGRDPLGVFRALWHLPDSDGRFRSFGGTSYVHVVEFSDPPHAHALLANGNATQPGSTHRGDQLRLYAAKELRPVWRDRAEIEANLESRETLERSPRR